MTNEEKLEFIKANYKASRTWELLRDGKDEFYTEWVNQLLRIVPHRLYKYRKCNNNNLNALKNRKAWFSNPSTWNDPIDVTVDYNLERDVKVLEEHFDDYVMKFAHSFVNHYIDSFCEQKKFVSAEKVKSIFYAAFQGDETINPERIVAYLEPVVGWKPARQIAARTIEAVSMVMTDQVKQQIVDAFMSLVKYNDIRNKMIMYSVSETYNNNHQWAMYADEGAGFCIGYLINPKTKVEATLIPNLLPIYYGEKKEMSIPRMLDETLEFLLRPEQIKDLVDQEMETLYVSLLTKKDEWNGEQEWRFSIPAEQVQSNLVDFDFAEVIYLGERITDYWKRRLIKIAKEQNLKVFQRKLNDVKSNWLYEELSIWGD